MPTSGSPWEGGFNVTILALWRSKWVHQHSENGGDNDDEHN
jgi:hypothetical protein